MSIESFIPAIGWLKGYKKEWLKGDVSAGLTVGVMLIPQGMAYALLAGLPPIYGLYAALVPILVYALFGTSRQLAVGPVAMDSLMVLAGVSAVAAVGTEYIIEVAILMAFAEGLVLMFLGLFRLGFLVNFLSAPVISGFTSAAALIIALNQFKHMLGVPLTSTHHLHIIGIEMIEKLGQWNWVSLSIGVISIVLLISIKRKAPKIPGALVVVVLSIITVYSMGLTSYEVSIVGEIPKGLPNFRLPAFDIELIQKLLPTILSLALVAFLEAISVAKAVHAKHRNYTIKPNQELVALGLANVIGSMFQSFSVTGGFSRTAVNDQAGANTPLASMISALLIGLTLLFLTPLFYYLPKAVLASIIVVAVLGLFNWQEPVKLWKTERLDLIMLLGTFVATLVFGIANGIGVGVGISLILVVYKAAYPHVAQLGLIEGTRYYRNILRFSKAKTFDELLIIRFDAQLFFANAIYFRDITLKWASEKKNLKAILFDFQAVNNIDSTACKVLDEMIDFYGSRNIQLLFAGVKGPVRDKMKAFGFVEKAKYSSFYMNVAEAKESFYNEAKPDSREYTHQANLS